MLVTTIRDHFHSGTYRKTGEEFEYQGKLYEHIAQAPVKRGPDVENENAGEENGEGDGKGASRK